MSDKSVAVILVSDLLTFAPSEDPLVNIWVTATANAYFQSTLAPSQEKP